MVFFTKQRFESIWVYDAGLNIVMAEISQELQVDHIGNHNIHQTVNLKVVILLKFLNQEKVQLVIELHSWVNVDVQD